MKLSTAIHITINHVGMHCVCCLRFPRHQIVIEVRHFSFRYILLSCILYTRKIHKNYLLVYIYQPTLFLPSVSSSSYQQHLSLDPTLQNDNITFHTPSPLSSYQSSHQQTPSLPSHLNTSSQTRRKSLKHTLKPLRPLPLNIPKPSPPPRTKQLHRGHPLPCRLRLQRPTRHSHKPGKRVVRSEQRGPARAAELTVQSRAAEGVAVGVGF